MKQSMEILKEIPQFHDTQRQLMLFQDRLEGMARPHLLAAFNKHETEMTLNFVNVFQKIDRNEQLKQHYYRWPLLFLLPLLIIIIQMSLGASRAAVALVQKDRHLCTSWWTHHFVVVVCRLAAIFL